MKQDLPFIGVLGIAVVCAVAAVAYLLTGGTETTTAIGVAITGAAVGQIVVVFLLMRHNEKNENLARRLVRDMAGVHSEVRRKTESLQARLDQVDQDSQSQAAMIANGFSDLKSSYTSLQTFMHTQMVKLQTPVASAPVLAKPVIADVVEEPAPERELELAAEPDPFADQILFSLEPIVDVQSGRTAHYRMHLAMMLDNTEMGHDQLLHYAGRVGKRAELDVVALREAFSLLQRLRQRDPQLNIFVNVGPETLADAVSISQIETERQNFGEHATGVVFEMTHSMLAGLSEAGLEGLARLARAGGQFSLTQVSVAGLDLHAMDALNVRYIGLPSASIDASGPSTSLIGFAQMARLSRVNVIITGLSNASLLTKLGSVARLACGPCFAAPRRVKRGMGGAPAQHEMAA